MTANCPTCAIPAPQTFVTSDLNHRIDRERFTYYTCPTCATVFLSPIPRDLGHYYPKNYYKIPATLQQLAVEAQVDRHKLDVLAAHAQPPGRLLEIGPAYGYFAFLAKEAGFTVEAIEMDAQCAQFLRETVGITVVNSADTVGALRDLTPFHAIALWHVVEHLPDPWGTLAAAVGRLLPGGILIVAAPNPEAFQFAMLRGWWVHVDAPRHVMLIPMASLRAKVEALGMEQVSATTGDAAAHGWDRFGWAYSLANMVRGRVLRKVMRTIGGALALVMRPFDRRSGRGSAYTMVFRKQGGR